MQLADALFQDLFAWNCWTWQCPTPWIEAFQSKSTVVKSNSCVNVWEHANLPLQLWNCAMQFQRAARAVRPLGAALSLHAICWAPNYRQEGLVWYSGKIRNKIECIWHVSQHFATLHISMSWPVTSRCCRPVGGVGGSWKKANGPCRMLSDCQRIVFLPLHKAHFTYATNSLISSRWSAATVSAGCLLWPKAIRHLL